MDLSNYDIRALKPKENWDLKEEIEPGPFQATLEEQARLKGPMSLELSFQVKEETLLYRGSVSGSWELECCRCLTYAPFLYDAKIEGSCPSSQPSLDAAEDVRQALILALPLRSYCKPDCRGLCLKCGTNKNTNPCGCPAP